MVEYKDIFPDYEKDVVDREHPIKVLRDFVLIQEVSKPEKIGMIYRPGIEDERILHGRVLRVGIGVLAPNGKLVPIEVEPGDLVAFDQSMAQRIYWKDKLYFVTNELSIRAVLL